MPVGRNGVAMGIMNLGKSEGGAANEISVFPMQPFRNPVNVKKAHWNLHGLCDSLAEAKMMRKCKSCGKPMKLTGRSVLMLKCGRCSRLDREKRRHKRR